jgi:hypothetical protein
LDGLRTSADRLAHTLTEPGRRMVLLPMLELGVVAVRPALFTLHFFAGKSEMEPDVAQATATNVKASSVKRRTG